jgi:hypothetical protein
MAHHPRRTVVDVIHVERSTAAIGATRAASTAEYRHWSEPGDDPGFARWWSWASSWGALDNPAGPGVALCLL